MDSGHEGGMVLRDRYVLRFLAQGGMGTVYEALDRKTDRTVIVKRASTGDPAALAAIVSERETLVRLDHPAIVKALDFFIEGNDQWLVLEHAQGKTLARLLESSSKPIDESMLRDWALQLAQALSYMHSQSPPLIYRDLKPEHCILQEDGRIRLIDFGIARIKKGSSRDTQALGTPGYAPPEQYGPPDAGETDERSDIYALGATLFHLATGKDPSEFPGGLPDPARFRPDLSQAMRNLIRRATEREAGSRYGGTRELIAELSAPAGENLIASVAGALEVMAVWALAFVVWRVAGLPAARLSGQEPWASPLGALLAAILGCALYFSLLAARRRGSPVAAIRKALLIAGARLSPAREVAPWRLGALTACLWYVSCFLLLSLLVAATGALDVHLRRFSEHLMTPPYSLVPPPPYLWALPGAIAGLVILKLLDALTGRKHSLLTFALISVLLCGAAAGWNRHLLIQDHRTQSDLLQESTLLWDVKFPGQVDTVMARDPEHGQITDIALSFNNGIIRSLDPPSGAVLWKFEDEALRVVHHTHHIADISTTEGISRMDIATGSLLWTTPGVRTVNYVGEGRGTLVLQSPMQDVYLIREEDGKLLGTILHPSDVHLEAGHGVVYVSNAETGTLRAVSLVDGKEKWTASITPGEGGTMGCDMSQVSWTNGTDFLIFDSKTGKHIASRRAGPSRAFRPRRLIGTHLREVQVSGEGSFLKFYRAPGLDEMLSLDLFPDLVMRAQADGDVLLAGTNHGKIFAFKIPEGNLLWERWDMPGHCYLWPSAAPALPFIWAERRAVMYQSPTRQAFLALDRESGDEFWSLPIDRGEQVRHVMWDGENMYIVLNTPQPDSHGKSRILRLRMSRRCPDRG